MNIEKLLNEKIIWKPEISGGIWYKTTFNGEKYKLRMNDFPDEPLYTLISNSEQIDVEDQPKSWTVE